MIEKYRIFNNEPKILFLTISNIFINDKIPCLFFLTFNLQISSYWCKSTWKILWQTLKLFDPPCILDISELHIFP